MIQTPSGVYFIDIDLYIIINCVLSNYWCALNYLNQLLKHNLPDCIILFSKQLTYNDYTLD